MSVHVSVCVCVGGAGGAVVLLGDRRRGGDSLWLSSFPVTSLAASFSRHGI